MGWKRLNAIGKVKRVGAKSMPAKKRGRWIMSVDAEPLMSDPNAPRVATETKREERAALTERPGQGLRRAAFLVSESFNSNGKNEKRRTE